MQLLLKSRKFYTMPSRWCAQYCALRTDMYIFVREKYLNDEEEECFEKALLSSIEENTHILACDGDYLITLFECDHFMFVKIKLCLSQSKILPDKR